MPRLHLNSLSINYNQLNNIYDNQLHQQNTNSWNTHIDNVGQTIISAVTLTMSAIGNNNFGLKYRQGITTVTYRTQFRDYE
jgi:hypothetical protein